MRISETFIVQSKTTGSTFSGSTEILIDELSNFANSDISLNTDNLNPLYDNYTNIGSTIKRFRSINTVSGNSSVWTSNLINSNNLNLGSDSNGEQRIITANNSIIQDDILLGGNY